MKSALNELMTRRGLDAFIVAGGEGYGVIRDYLTNGAHITHGFILKKRDAEMVLVVGGMEIEEAKKSGLPCYTYAEMGMMDIYQTTTDPDQVQTIFWGKLLQAIGVEKGKIGVYGRGDLHTYLHLITLLKAAYPQYEFVGEGGLTLFEEAMLTKDESELARLKSVAQRTNEVLEATWNFIAAQRLSADETVIKTDGTPLTIGEVKRFVIQALLERGLEDTGMIFAQGRDGAFPHSRGENEQALKAGQPIVFDLFPREMGGGFHHDVTRTWCIGYAPPKVSAIYDTVMQAFDRALEAFGVGKPTRLMQETVLDYFEGLGHPTQRSHPGTMEGYVHSLGHGVGLNIHERPAISHLRDEDTFQVGSVVTIEPGLYYPEQGVGMRVEDLLIVTEQGELISLSPFKKDLIIPMK